MHLNSHFFKRNTVLVAQDLLGKFLVRKIGKNKLSGMIVETEAYVGPHDLACHASKGKTDRTKVMFEPAGTWYVYMIYGMYYCLNIVTEAKNYPSAVLIRALEPTNLIEFMVKNRNLVPSSQLSVPSRKKLSTDHWALITLSDGPGKLCRALRIDKKLNCTSAVSKDAKLYIEDRGVKISKAKIVKSKRIGVAYAGSWKDRKLRFYIKGNQFVSQV